MVERICLTCTKTFKVKPSSLKWNKCNYCCRDCYREAEKKMKKNYAINERHGMWRGDEVKYRALHTWIEGKRGIEKECQICGTHESGRFVWANVNEKYLRNEFDWLRLCSKCHAKFDMTFFKKLGNNQFSKKHEEVDKK